MTSTRDDLNLSGNLSLLDLDNQESSAPSLNLIEDTPCELNIISPSELIGKGESAAEDSDPSRNLFPDQSIHCFDSDLPEDESSESESSCFPLCLSPKLDHNCDFQRSSKWSYNSHRSDHVHPSP